MNNEITYFIPQDLKAILSTDTPRTKITKILDSDIYKDIFSNSNIIEQFYNEYPMLPFIIKHIITTRKIKDINNNKYRRYILVSLIDADDIVNFFSFYTVSEITDIITKNECISKSYKTITYNTTLIIICIMNYNLKLYHFIKNFAKIHDVILLIKTSHQSGYKNKYSLYQLYSYYQCKIDDLKTQDAEIIFRYSLRYTWLNACILI